MSKRRGAVAVLRAARVIVALAMLGSVLAGALGFGPDVKAVTAALAGGAGVVVIGIMAKALYIA